MAEFALGLTKTAVEGTLSRVKSAIEEEAKLKEQVQNDLVFITGEFQMMQSFLSVASSERAKNQVVRTWVRQIRDLAFDVEDCVEFVVHLDARSRWSWLWRVLPSACAAAPPHLDQAVAEIRLLKARVEDVSQRNTRYSLISDSGSSSDSKVPAVSQPSSVLEKDTAAAVAFHVLREVWESAGKRSAVVVGDLKTLIAREGASLQVISLWWPEAADLGASRRIIGNAYGDREICQEFPCRAWVKLAHPFSPREFIASLLNQFDTMENEAPPTAYDLMKAELVEHLSNKRYLVVLEDVQTVADWDAIRSLLQDSGKGSRIVVSTNQSGVAASCTGEPYQVSELTRFSNGQSLCVFFSKVPGLRSDMGEFMWKLRFGGVISVWGISDGKSTMVNKVYAGITHRWKEFDVVGQFEWHSWVEVPDPFDLEVFSRRLFLNFHSSDLRAKEIAAVGMMGGSGIIEECRKLLHEENCFVVINGLRYPKDWDLIKATFILESVKGCIIIITEDVANAKRCVDGEEKDAVFNVKDLEADTGLRHLIMGCRYYGIGGKVASRRGQFLSSSNRWQEALDWIKRFSNVVPYLRNHSSIWEHNMVLCSLGTTHVWKSVFVREYYYNQLLLSCDEEGTHHKYYGQFFSDHMGFTAYSWVDVPHPFNLTDFSWRLVMDFLSDDFEAKEFAAENMMKGHEDPYEVCREIMRKHKYLVVIDGLHSTHDWDLIKDAFLSESMNGTIFVITDDVAVATHCVKYPWHVLKVKDLEAPHTALGPFIMDGGNGRKQDSRFPCNRKEEAYHWFNTLHVGHQPKAIASLAGHLKCPGVISIWGIAGVGKSALAKHVYYMKMLGLYKFLGNVDVELWYHEEKFTAFSWVDVSYPFNLMDFSRHLLLDFHSDDLQAKEITALGMLEGQDPIQECRKFLRQEKCYVVIDGLRSTDDWDLIRAAFFPEPTRGCIVVITYEASVAAYCADDDDRVLNIKGLELDSALRLFRKIAWAEKKVTPHIMELSELIIAKCGGLPKVIAALGEWFARVVAGSGEDLGAEVIGLLKGLNDEFMGILEKHPIFQSLRGLFSWMQSYFDACPDSLKPCIFYLSIFPIDSRSIRRRRLLRRWIAEGYSRGTPTGSTAEEEGEEFFSELIKLSIIQMQSPSSKVLFQVNGFFHGYIMSRQMEDNLVFELEGCCSPNLRLTGQHLTVRSSWVRDEIVYQSIDFSRLRSLTVSGKWESFLISSSNMRMLRVLDLEDLLGLTDDELVKIGKLPPRLKFLSLRGCRNISLLPSSLGLGDLRQLQTLDVRHTRIVSLPPAIMKLQKLQYIRVGTTVSLDADVRNTSFFVLAQPGEEEDAATSHLPVAATPMEEEDDGTHPFLLRAAASATAAIISPWRSSGSNRRLYRNNRLHSHVLNGGVEISAAGIGKLTNLHTLGVVNVSGSVGKAILKELKKLTQLRKLGVSAINRENWQELCHAISGHYHLESLSVRLDKDMCCCFSDISDPPRTLKSLKVRGGAGPGSVHIRPAWLKQLHNLQKVDLDVTILTQEDIDVLQGFPQHSFLILHRLCVKPIQDGVSRLSFGDSHMMGFRTIEIDCGGSRRLELHLGVVMAMYVEVIKVCCSSGSSLQLDNLRQLLSLKEVWLMGSSYDDDLKRDLLKQFSDQYMKLVLKQVQEPRAVASSSS